ncbi:unnamed protein product [Heligmosomoides polygyrus]|uniref:Uncharacterized protein n=1 Tax=Heligmosomoides polygyrus TaxID=6339 RepID=A0A3P8AUX9_HELPZ|nr:unnamed protein product [Heligmosomoides polygyrus]
MIIVRHRCVTIAVTVSRTRVKCHAVKHEILPSSTYWCSPGYAAMLCAEGDHVDCYTQPYALPVMSERSGRILFWMRSALLTLDFVRVPMISLDTGWKVTVDFNIFKRGEIFAGFSISRMIEIQGLLKWTQPSTGILLVLGNLRNDT